MPKHRPPKEIWDELRRKVWERDGGRCQSPLSPPICQGKPHIPLEVCHIDHIKSGKLAGNELSNLRVLCPACHALRLDKRHRGLIAKALRDNLIPADWRQHVWSDSSPT
jgi:5-methylcytosine-specific restriction enzyme A